MPQSAARAAAPIPPKARKPADRRNGALRHKLLMRVAAVRVGELTGFGIVRNVSETGMMLEVKRELPRGTAIEIDLGDARRLSGEVRWSRWPMIGVAFAHPIDVPAVLSKTAPAPDRRVRLPRIGIAIKSRIVRGSELLLAEIRDIALGGVRIGCPQPLRVGETVSVLIPGVGPVHASVRWYENDAAGLAFFRPLDVHSLMRWPELLSVGCAPGGS